MRARSRLRVRSQPAGGEGDERDVLYQRFVERVGFTGVDRRFAVIVRRKHLLLRSEHARLPLQVVTLPGASVEWDGERHVEVVAKVRRRVCVPARPRKHRC